MTEASVQMQGVTSELLGCMGLDRDPCVMLVFPSHGTAELAVCKPEVLFEDPASVCAEQFHMGLSNVIVFLWKVEGMEEAALKWAEKANNSLQVMGVIGVDEFNEIHHIGCHHEPACPQMPIDYEHVKSTQHYEEQEQEVMANALPRGEIRRPENFVPDPTDPEFMEFGERMAEIIAGPQDVERTEEDYRFAGWCLSAYTLGSAMLFAATHAEHDALSIALERMERITAAMHPDDAAPCFAVMAWYVLNLGDAEFALKLATMAKGCEPDSGMAQFVYRLAEDEANPLLLFEFAHHQWAEMFEGEHTCEKGWIGGDDE